MHRYYAIPAAITAALGLTGCATVVRGDHTAWEVNTVPPGASVKTTNGFYCDSTPCAIQMPRRSDFSADIVKPGYKMLKVTVTHKIAAGGGRSRGGLDGETDILIPRSTTAEQPIAPRMAGMSNRLRPRVDLRWFRHLPRG